MGCEIEIGGFFGDSCEGCGVAVEGDRPFDSRRLLTIYAVDKVKEMLGSKYQMRESHRLGFGDRCSQSATVLTTGLSPLVKPMDEIEPDRRHTELIVQGLGMNGVSTPSVKPTDAQAAVARLEPSRCFKV